MYQCTMYTCRLQLNFNTYTFLYEFKLFCYTYLNNMKIKITDKVR